MLPPDTVRSAFGCTALPVPLPGGQGEAVRCGEIVLKPCHDAEEASWIAQMHVDITPGGFRLPQPVRAEGVGWVAEGWQAWSLVAGVHASGRWPEVIATCRAFHRATATIARPALLARRTSPFARADRIAWGEEPADCVPTFRPVVEKLLSLLNPSDLPSQLIHGDVAGNVLFADGLPPAVIDVSPYWRPAAYAEAIVVADALDWYEADASILELVADIPELDQLMARAEIFRIAILDGLHREGADTLDAVSEHMRTVEWLEDRLG
jgi:uncharacterized protein (TIGR02569 family)